MASWSRTSVRLLFSCVLDMIISFVSSSPVVLTWFSRFFTSLPKILSETAGSCLFSVVFIFSLDVFPLLHDSLDAGSLSEVFLVSWDISDVASTVLTEMTSSFLLCEVLPKLPLLFGKSGNSISPCFDFFNNVCSSKVPTFSPVSTTLSPNLSLKPTFCSELAVSFKEDNSFTCSVIFKSFGLDSTSCFLSEDTSSAWEITSFFISTNSCCLVLFDKLVVHSCKSVISCWSTPSIVSTSTGLNCSITFSTAVLAETISPTSELIISERVRSLSKSNTGNSPTNRSLLPATISPSTVLVCMRLEGSRSSNSFLSTSKGLLEISSLTKGERSIGFDVSSFPVSGLLLFNSCNECPTWVKLVLCSKSCKVCCIRSRSDVKTSFLDSVLSCVGEKMDEYTWVRFLTSISSSLIKS